MPTHTQNKVALFLSMSVLIFEHPIWIMCAFVIIHCVAIKLRIDFLRSILLCGCDDSRATFDSVAAAVAANNTNSTINRRSNTFCISIHLHHHFMLAHTPVDMLLALGSLSLFLSFSLILSISYEHDDIFSFYFSISVYLCSYVLSSCRLCLCRASMGFHEFHHWEK